MNKYLIKDIDKESVSVYGQLYIHIALAKEGIYYLF